MEHQHTQKQWAVLWIFKVGSWSADREEMWNKRSRRKRISDMIYLGIFYSCRKKNSTFVRCITCSARFPRGGKDPIHLKSHDHRNQDDDHCNENHCSGHESKEITGDQYQLKKLNIVHLSQRWTIFPFSRLQCDCLVSFPGCRTPTLWLGDARALAVSELSLSLMSYN